MMTTFDIDDLTSPLMEKGETFGAFEPDPSDQFIQRYIPSEDEQKRIEEYLKDELDRAYEDDQPARGKKLDLLRAYWAQPTGNESIITQPLVKRAVNQNAAWIINTIMQHKPLVTVTPDSNQTINVLVDDPQYGAVPIPKTSEEVAKAIELYLEYKLRKKLKFRDTASVAAMECLRGQTPTWVKVVHHAESRKARSPKYTEKGPVSVTFSSKEDIDIIDKEATRFCNISTYSMLMPAGESDPQESPWIAEWLPTTNSDMRASFVNGDYFLIPDKDEWTEFLRDGAEPLASPDIDQKGQAERRVPSKPKMVHDRYEVHFDWVVPAKQTLVESDAEGGQTTKTVTVNQEYPMVANFHRKLGRLLSMIRAPYDHGQREYVAFYNRKEPFRNAGGSVAEDVLPAQRVISELTSLEIRGGVIATTPITFSEPGSVAGDYLAENEIEPGANIPRQRPDEVEMTTMGERPVSLLGLITHLYQQYERDTSIGDLQLGLNVPGRTPASSIAQILNQGETQASLFLEDFRAGLADVIKLYIQTVQQYLRFGETIPFDPETKATVMAALEGQGGDQAIPDQVPIRFPMQGIQNEFAFNVAASADDRSAQGDFDKLVALKQIIDQDGQQLAQIIQPLASGQVPEQIAEVLIEQITRSQFVMGLIAKSMRHDGDKFRISPQLIQALAQEQQQVAQQMQMQQQMAQQQQQEGQQNGPQGAPGTQPNAGGGAPSGGGQPGGMGQPVPQQSVPQQPPPNPPQTAQSPFGQTQG